MSSNHCATPPVADEGGGRYHIDIQVLMHACYVC